MGHGCFRQGRAGSLAALCIPSLLAIVAGLWASPAAAQCTLVSGQSPLQFEPSPPGVPRPIGLAGSHTNGLDLYQVGGSSRLMVMEAWGYSVLDLSNPGNPTATAYHDMRAQIPVNGDGQGYVVSLAAAEDGTRAIVSLHGNVYNDVLMQAGNPDGSFIPAGDFLFDSSAVAIQKLGSRYIGWALTGNHLTAADITTFVPGGGPSSITAELTGFPGGNSLLVTGPYVVYQGSSGVVVIDASSPAASIPYTAGMPNQTIPDLAWQRPAGDSPRTFTAAVDPADGTATPRLYLLGEFFTSAGTRSGYTLMTLTGGANGTLSVVGSFTPPAPYGGAGSSQGGLVSLVPRSNDLIAFMWARGTTSTVSFKLYTKTAGDWGAAPGEVTVDWDTYPSFGLREMRSLVFGSNVYSYIVSSLAAYVLPLDCASTTGQDGGSATDAGVRAEDDAGAETSDAGEVGLSSKGCGCGSGGASPVLLAVLLLGTTRLRKRQRAADALAVKRHLLRGRRTPWGASG